jgi:uncharacterized protein (DUF169 family)
MEHAVRIGTVSTLTCNPIVISHCNRLKTGHFLEAIVVRMGFRVLATVSEPRSECVHLWATLNEEKILTRGVK